MHKVLSRNINFPSLAGREDAERNVKFCLPERVFNLIEKTYEQLQGGINAIIDV